MLKFNPDPNVIFDNDEAAVAPIREITRDEIPDLIANGAGVDPSANVGEQTSSAATTAGDVQAAQDPAVPATASSTAGEQGNVQSAPVSPRSSDASSALVETNATVTDGNTVGSATGNDATDGAVPLADGGAANAEAGSADAGESKMDLSAGPNGSGSDEHPLTIIGEIEVLVRMIGNTAVHEYQRLIQRLADLKNHPTIKDGE
ncbi:hypothetical protein CBA19CS22_00605 [Caballeronia novacaledonica]|uniref:Uncharacterized protein n=1 Tax=Caballeronia novacaledonica TaxID=1544861 RepID=A0ACB5QK31_9BURK|nr:hypothetical protein CBA19CS22_00605 [Caballeronia novacaledonica]